MDNKEPQPTMEQLQKELKAGKSVKATDFARAMGIDVIEF